MRDKYQRIVWGQVKGAMFNLADGSGEAQYEIEGQDGQKEVLPYGP